jgi:hypothetical protein
MGRITTRKDPTSPHTHHYNDIHPDFGKEVEEHFLNQKLLRYYPYTDNYHFEYWLTGEVDLRDVYKEKRNKNLTEWDYVYSITEEIARAMNYLMVHGTMTLDEPKGKKWWIKQGGYDRQRREAFANWQLIHSGHMEWTKKPLEGLTEKQKVALYYECQEEAKKLYGNDHKSTEPKTKEYLELKKKSDEYNLKKYGVYKIWHFPLTQASNTTRKPKIFYTKQELAAIDLIVAMNFENLC